MQTAVAVCIAAVRRAASWVGDISLPSRLRYNHATAERDGEHARMLKPWQFWCLTVVAAIAAVLAVANIVLYTQNRDGQADMAGRAQYVQQSVQLESLYREIIKALADLSVTKQDKALTELLARQGITVTVTAPAPAGPGETKKGAK